jgi:type IV pilus assembly protein PilB
MGSSSPAKKLSLVTRRKFGEVLCDLKLLTLEEVEAATQRSLSKKLRIGDLLLQEGILSPVDVAKALALQYGLDYIDLDEISIQPDAPKRIPEKLARSLGVIPVSSTDEISVIAVSDPLQALKLESTKTNLTGRIELKVCSKTQIELAISRNYRDDHVIESIVRQLSKKPELEKKPVSAISQANTAQKELPPSIESLVNKFIERAIHDRASDIHLDPAEEKVRVRFRIDGVLHELFTYPNDIHQSIVSRVKVLSHLDISEKRHPQDGAFHHPHGPHPIDVRVSTLPTVFGEKIVLRLLDKSMMRSNLTAFGMSREMESEVLRLLQRPYGIILLTGPTGSGKTTSLYSMLNQINGIEKNIITVEDPIEFKFDIINQVQVNEKAGLTFAGLLRNILRQDPDVVMIGEVRDQETADLAVRAALTGHLVLSTIHTNDSVSTPTRLIDMGVEPFLLSSGLTAVLAQRLVRVLCSACRRQVPVTDEQIKNLGTGPLKTGDLVFESVGCDKCLRSGYVNRIALFELMPVDDFVRKAIIDRLPESEIQKYLLQNGFISMRMDGIKKIAAGITSIDEVLKATI